MDVDSRTEFLPDLVNLNAWVNDLGRTSNYDQLLIKLDHIAVAVGRTRQHIASIKNRHTSISVLPNEILVSIFEMGHNMHFIKSQETDEMLYSVRLSHVSSHWRKVSIQTPTLWTTWSTFPYRSMPFFQMLRQRAQFASLDIHLCDLDSRKSRSHPARASGILDLALPFIQRWRSLSIVGSSHHSIHKVLDLLRDASAPCLEELSIRLNADVDEDDEDLSIIGDVHDFRIFNDAGHLSSLQLWGISLHSCQPPLTALTHLNLTDGVPLSYPKFRRVLDEVSRSLIHLCFAANDIVSADFTLIPVKMQVLQSFHLASWWSDHCHILEIILAPELSHLSFENMTARGWNACQRFLECKARPSRYPKLRSLHLHNSYENGILAAFPTITDLDITGVANDHVLEDLLDSDRDRSSLMVSKLKSLICAVPDQDMMHRLIASREAWGHPLDQVVLDAGDGSENSVQWQREHGRVGKATRTDTGMPIKCNRCGWPSYRKGGMADRRRFS